LKAARLLAVVAVAMRTGDVPQPAGISAKAGAGVTRFRHRISAPSHGAARLQAWRID
jgi:hypothetical protein